MIPDNMVLTRYGLVKSYGNIGVKITYRFQNFKGATIEVWEWIHNFISLYNGLVYAGIKVKPC